MIHDMCSLTGKQGTCRLYKNQWMLQDAEGAWGGPGCIDSVTCNQAGDLIFRVHAANLVGGI